MIFIDDRELLVPLYGPDGPLTDAEREALRAAEFNEADHPRDKEGQFADRAGNFVPDTRPIVVYHGTQTEALASIKAHGLSPFNDSMGADEYAHQQGANMSGPARVYVTESMSSAMTYARYAADVNEGSVPVILEISVPAEYWKAHAESADQGDATAFEGTIPPEWITRVTDVEDSVWAVPAWRALSDMHIVYAVLLTKEGA